VFAETRLGQHTTTADAYQRKDKEMNQNQRLILDACVLIEKGDYAGGVSKAIAAIYPAHWNPANDPEVRSMYLKTFGSDDFGRWVYSLEGDALISELQAKFRP
jgi:hypothetical protein